MPFPDIPSATHKGQETINGVKCNYYLYTDHNTRVHMYIAINNAAPVRLIQESYENETSIPLLTYDFSNVILGAPTKSVFEIPEPFTHNVCEKHTGGFPYIHIFHYFVRF